MNDKPYRNSRQRQRLLSLLQSTDSHPTADWLYERMKPDFPSLSLGTVYRNLGILEEQGRLIRISGGSSFDRYDGNVEPHAHFMCNQCHRVYDIDMEWDDDLLEKLQLHMDHQAENYILHCWGRCTECKGKE